MENMKTCDICGELVNVDTMVIVDELNVCPVCINDRFVRCERCGDLVYTDDAIYAEDSGAFYCDYCAERVLETCDECGRIVEAQNTSDLYSGGSVCADCIGNGDYIRCEDCGDMCHIDDAEEVRDNWYCPDCVPEDNAIESYGRTRGERFFGDDGMYSAWANGRTRYYGIELEVEAKGNTSAEDGARTALELLGDDFVQTKYDGSLIDGFEMASQPATYEFHSNLANWKKLLPVLVGMGFRSHDAGTCGLHIHVSRAALGETLEARSETIAKIILLIGQNWDEVVKFSRRDYDSLEQWAKKNNYDSAESVDDILMYSRGDRYQAVNITNDSTIEFRFFRGTLNYNTFCASLEFVKMVIDYALEHDFTDCLTAKPCQIFRGCSDNFRAYAKRRELVDFI